MRILKTLPPALAVVAAMAGAAGGQADPTPAGDTIPPPEAVAPEDTIPGPAVYRLDPIEATVARGTAAADRVPFAISVVESGALHPANPAVDLEDVLRRVPGVLIGNRHNLAMDTRVVVRGFGARSGFGVRGVRLILDGIPLTLPDGQAALTNIDPGSIGRVEILRGPAAALYGNAAGGVISLTSAEPPPTGLVEATTTTATYGTDDPARLLRFQATAGSGGTRDSWFVGLSHLSTQGFREHARARRTGLNARYRRMLGARTSLAAVLNVAAVPLAENPGALPLDSARARPRMAWPQNVSTAASKEVTQGQGGVAVTHHLGAMAVEVAAHGLLRDMHNPLPFGRYIRLDRSGGGARILLRSATGADDATGWTVGAEAQTQSDDRIERDNLAGEMGGAVHQDRVDRVTSVAPFALGQWAVHPRVALRAGGRYDAVTFSSDDRLGDTPDNRSARRTLDAWSGSAGAVLDLGAGVRGWGSVSTWFQTPTTTELINVPPAPGAPCCQSGFNPELEPQDGWGWEAGVAGRHGAVAWELVVFDLDVRNEILPFQVEGIEGRDFYRNAGRSTHRGAEVGAGVALGPAWSVDLAYTLSDFRFVRPQDPTLADNRLPGVPPHRLDGRAAWRGGPNRVELTVEWSDRTPVNDANTDHAPSFALVDVRVARAFTTGAGAVEPFVALTNVFDTRYSASLVINAFGGRYHEPGPGRAMLVGARARFR